MKGNTGLYRLYTATIYSAKGFWFALKNEAAFRQEAAAFVVMFPTALVLDVAPLEKLALVVSLFLVLTVELLNSAVEAVVDRFGKELHPLSGAAKDMGSAAVLCSLFICGSTWVVIVMETYWP